MGTEDMRRQKPNVERMGLLGARVEPVEAGARTLKEAVSAAIRDWVTNVETTHYIIGSCVGPAPYPALVRDLQRVIGDEARAQVLERAGRLPQRVIACVGGGSNSIGMFIAVRGRRRRRAGRGRGRRGGARHRPPRRAADGAAACAGVLHGAYSAIMQDEDGQILEAHSISAGLDYPGSGPEHAWLRDSGPRALRRGHRRAGARGVRAAGAAGGDHPRAGERPRARLGARQRPDSELDLSASPAAATRTSPRRWSALTPRPMTRRCERIAEAFARAARRRPPRGADALPDGRLPGPRDLARDRRSPTPRPAPTCRARGAVLRPARRRPGDPRRRHRGAARRGDAAATCSRSAGAIAERVPVVVMCYANPILARGLERFARRARSRPAPAG